MSNVFDVLVERGIVAQVTHEEPLREMLEKEKVTFYIGFDPTGDSLHIGHFVQIMVMAHMQRAGHRPIALVGGGTAMVGDPSGKTDMRKMLTHEQIKHNADSIKQQLARFIDFGEGKAIMVDNGDWLLKLNYVEFLRDIGVHFSVNRMLSAECFKSRLERGLNFIEFNYMLMQSYDFLKLYQDYGCRIELGGDDQWSNILGGVELIRRVESKDAYGLTFSLLTTSEGKKMGKTEKGALWLDAEKTSPYDFYQYLRNVQDADVIKCLKLLTFVSMEEIERLSKLEGSAINDAKKLLAFEVTRMVHGEEEAKKCQQAAEALFGSGGAPVDMPGMEIGATELGEGMNVLDLLLKAGLIPSKGEGRRLATQGGLVINDEKIEDINYVVTAQAFKNGELMIRKGKKTYFKITLQ